MDSTPRLSDQSLFEALLGKGSGLARTVIDGSLHPDFDRVAEALRGQLAGYDGGAPRAEQSAMALETIRVLTSLAPALFLGLAIWLALRYPLSRAAHQRVLDRLERRKRSL